MQQFERWRWQLIAHVLRMKANDHSKVADSKRPREEQKRGKGQSSLLKDGVMQEFVCLSWGKGNDKDDDDDDNDNVC